MGRTSYKCESSESHREKNEKKWAEVKINVNCEKVYKLKETEQRPLLRPSSPSHTDFVLFKILLINNLTANWSGLSRWRRIVKNNTNSLMGWERCGFALPLCLTGEVPFGYELERGLANIKKIPNMLMNTYINCNPSNSKDSRWWWFFRHESIKFLLLKVPTNRI